MRIDRVITEVLLVTILLSGCLGGVSTPSASTPTAGEFTPERSLDDRLQINTLSDQPVTVVVRVPAANNETIFEETYPPESGLISLENTSATTAVYHVRLLSGEEIVWERRVSSSEGYHLVVAENGSVSVSSYSEV